MWRCKRGRSEQSFRRAFETDFKQGYGRMQDAWEQHVMLEISEALGNPERLLAIQQALMQMWRLDLIPEDGAGRIWLYFSDVAGL